MVYMKIPARLGGKAFLPLAKTVFKLLFAGRTAEVCGRTAYVVDISFKFGHLRELFRLLDYRFLTAAGNTSALMKSNRTEVAVAEAPVEEIVPEKPKRGRKPKKKEDEE